MQNENQSSSDNINKNDDLSLGPKQKMRELKGRIALLLSDAEITSNELKELHRLTAELKIYNDIVETEWTKKDDAELQTLLAEYHTLRTESLGTISIRTNILLLGLAAIGAVYAGAVQIGNPTKNAEVMILLFSGIIPIISLIVLIVWVGEAMRMKRVNDYLSSEVEQKINRKFGQIVLSWESSLKTGLLSRDNKFGPSMIVFGLIIFSIALSPIVGLKMIGKQFNLLARGAPLWELWLPWGLVGIVSLFFWINRKRILNDPRIKTLSNAK